MTTEVNLLPHGQENDYPHIECCIVNCSGVCTIFFKTCIRYLKGMLYYAVINSVWDTLDYFHVYAQTVLWAVKHALAHNGCGVKSTIITSSTAFKISNAKTVSL